MQELRDIQWLALNGRLEALQALDDQQWSKAADIYLSIVKTGHGLARGPLISLLFGIAIEKVGLDGIDSVAPQLTRNECTQLAAKLEELQRTRITMDEVIQRERYYLRLNSPNLLITLFGPLAPPLRKPLAQAEGKLDRIRQDLDESVEALRTNGR